jgi:hypothetical protein
MKLITPSSAEVKNAGILSPFPQYLLMAWCLIDQTLEATREMN